MSTCPYFTSIGNPLPKTCIFPIYWLRHIIQLEKNHFIVEPENDPDVHEREGQLHNAHVEEDIPHLSLAEAL